MKRFGIFAILSALVLSSTAVPVYAVNTLTDSQVETIRRNCRAAQASIYRLRSSDALMRVSMGRRYVAMNLKLMSPMNSRSSLNHLDPVELVSVTSKYMEEYTAFTNQYIAYRNEVDNALALNCTNQPVTFYDTVRAARANRQELHATAQKLNAHIAEYRQKFDTFAKTIPEEGRK